MANVKLIEIDNFLSNPSFFDFLKSLDADDALDSRDEPAFDNRWIDEYNSLKKIQIQSDDLSFIDLLREKAFKSSFRTCGESEIASRISDDIDLIARSLISGKDTGWAVIYLWPSYKNGHFPV